MSDAPLFLLFMLLAVLVLMSGFFSSSETSMMSLNRYRLKHLSKNNHRAALRSTQLLNRPDRLIGVILIGNNLVNNLAVSIMTVIAMRIASNPDQGIYVGTIVLTFVILIFAEVTPKTVAALYPERIAFPASYILKPLLKLMFPAVSLVNGISNNLLRLVKVDVTHARRDQLDKDELRTLLKDTGGLISPQRQSMLLGILDLEKVTVADIMVPRNEVAGIDLNDDLDKITDFLRSIQHTRLPIFEHDINNVKGILHMRNATRFMSKKTFSKEDILSVAREPYFVLETTSLYLQLLNFQQQQRRIGIVVDEYGDVQGIVTLEDILEEIVGEFTTDHSQTMPDIHPQSDNSFIIDGAAYLREINRSLGWNLPTDGPKTINGLVTEHLEHIPDTNVCIRIGVYLMEVLQVKDNAIRNVRVWVQKIP